MSEKYYIGRKTSNLTKSPTLLPFSKVVIIVGDDEETGEQLIYEAGDDSGRTLELTNPWGTQQIANDMLARIKGYVYKPFEARESLLSDDADLGDAVTVGDVYSVIINQDLEFDGLGVSTVSAPNADETENEFGDYRSAADRALARRFNTITTRFTVQLGKIESLIEDTADDLSTRITQTKELIELEAIRAQGAEGTIQATLTLQAEEIASKITNGEAQTLITQGLHSISLSAVAGTNQSTITIRADGVYVDSIVAKFSNIEADSIVANASIVSPTIYGGHFYATGEGAYDEAAYYIYDKYENGKLGNKVGYLSYDSNGAGEDYENKYRVLLTTLENTALKIQSAGNMSLTANGPGGIYVMSPLRIFGGIYLSQDSYGSLANRPSGTRGQVYFATS